MSPGVELLIDGVAAGLVVHALEYREKLGELFEAVATVEPTGDFAAVQGATGADATLQWEDRGALTRLTGIVRRVRQIARRKGMRFEIAVASRLWLLTQRTAHRIFRNVGVEELARELLHEYGRIGAPTSRLVERHPKRETIVQYGETDWAFLQRVLADEGCAIAVDHARGGAPVLVDDTSRPADVLAVPFVPDADALADDGTPRVLAAALTTELRPGRVVVRDYDFVKPGHRLAGEATRARDGGSVEDVLEHYVFEVGRFGDDGGGADRARRILEERRVGARALACETSFAAAPGQYLALRDHPTPGVDDTYLVTSTELRYRHDSEDAGFSCSLDCIPASSTFRPPRRDKPRIVGTQTAVVLGAAGEAIDVDEHGRVEVAFRWDRRDPTSTGATRRVRVAQGWGGAGYGLMTLPRVGDEVVVSFIDGDPDEPIVVGHVHNGARPLPVSLPASKTQSVWRSQSLDAAKVGFNQIVMEDAAGQERLELRAERDWVQSAENDQTTSVGGSSQTKVAGSASSSVGGSASASVGGTASLDVAKDQNVTVGESASVTANVAWLQVFDEILAMAPTIQIMASDQRLDKSGTAHTVVAPDVTVVAESRAQVVSGTFHVAASAELVLVMGASLLRMSADGIELSSGGSRITLGPAGITIDTPAIVDVKGTFIKLNS